MPFAADDLPFIVAVALFVLALAISRTVRRVLVAFAVGVRYAGHWLVRWLSGEKKMAPELVRRAFEDLGPTYIKLGQIVASSHGLFPRAYVAEFQKCLDRVRPFP